MSLCQVCSAIDPDFFSPAHDDDYFHSPTVVHRPTSWIKRSAQSGCQLCSFLVDPNINLWLDWGSHEDTPVIFTRGYSSLEAYVEKTCVAWINYLHVPQTWHRPRKAKPGQPQQDIDIMLAWIRNCLYTHPGCSRATQSNFMPTRLLDVQALPESTDIRLVLLDDRNDVASYVALSHCWGPTSKHPLSTTTSNLNDHLQQIPFDSLSLTFKDAVNWTTSLGQRYLWIDSLCIVQDSPDDWLRESGKMAAVYGNSLFTLSALSSQDHTQGCRVETPANFFDFDYGPHRIRFFKRRRTWHEEYGNHAFVPEHNPLRGRAWALQERVLSERNINFSKNLVLWECSMMRSSSDSPWIEETNVVSQREWPMKNSCNESLQPHGSAMIRHEWYKLMEDYMSRKLTKGSDKLPALSGLAQSFQRKLGSSDYLAGIWTEHLPYSLLWNMADGNNAQRSRTYRAPSWSFLSLDGSMSYESQMLTNARQDWWQGDPRDSASAFVDILNHRIELDGWDQFGAVSRASLALRARVLQVNLKLRDEDEQYEYPWDIIDRSDGSRSGAFFPDIAGEILADTRVWCIAIRVEPEAVDSYVQAPFWISGYFMNHPVMVMGLALQLDAENVNRFRRVGLIRWMKRSAFDGVELSDLTMV